MCSSEYTIHEMSSFRQKMRVFCLYYAAFPAAERKPFSMILSMKKKGKTDIWYLERKGKFAGFATTINGEGLVLIDYLAVPNRRRGRGAGSKALELIREKYAGQGVFVEIESVFEAGKDQEERIRRKQFYLKNGMKELHVLADVFGVRMELLGWDCEMDFERYQAFYRENYSPWAAEHLTDAEYPR